MIEWYHGFSTSHPRSRTNCATPVRRLRTGPCSPALRRETGFAIGPELSPPGIVDANLRRLCTFASGRDEQLPQIGRKEAGASAGYGLDPTDLRITIGVLLLVHPNRPFPSAGINPFPGVVVEHVVRVADRRQALDYFSSCG